MKKINSLGVILGLSFIYVWFYLFLNLTSNNMAFKENTYINKAMASIKVYEDSLQSTEFSTWSADLFNGKWTSNEFPNGSYSKVSIIYWNEETPVPSAISTSVSYIYRHSH